MIGARFSLLKTDMSADSIRLKGEVICCGKRWYNVNKNILTAGPAMQGECSYVDKFKRVLITGM